MMHSDKYIQALVGSQSFFKIRPRSLVDFIELSASHGEKPYLIYQDKVISFTQHLRLVKKAAHILQSQHNVKPGDRVAIYAANCPEWIIFFWATVSLGAIACGLTGWWKGSEAMKAINDADPNVVISDQKRFTRISDQVKHSTLIIEEIDLASYVHEINSFVRIDEDECACLLYTSGTTGTPKGVMTSHRSMIAN